MALVGLGVLSVGLAVALGGSMPRVASSVRGTSASAVSGRSGAAPTPTPEHPAAPDATPTPATAAFR